MVHIGHGIGAEEFPSHAAAFERFDQIKSFIFVLDEDKRDSAADRKLRKHVARDPVFFLPSQVSASVKTS